MSCSMAGIRTWARHDATIIRVKTRTSYMRMYKNGDVPLPVYYDFGNGTSATNITLIILLSFYLWR